MEKEKVKEEVKETKIKKVVKAKEREEVEVKEKVREGVKEEATGLILSNLKKIRLLLLQAFESCNVLEPVTTISIVSPSFQFKASVISLGIVTTKLDATFLSFTFLGIIPSPF